MVPAEVTTGVEQGTKLVLVMVSVVVYVVHGTVDEEDEVCGCGLVVEFAEVEEEMMELELELVGFTELELVDFTELELVGFTELELVGFQVEEEDELEVGFTLLEELEWIELDEDELDVGFTLLDEELEWM